MPFSKAAALASVQRRKIVHTSDKVSILRQAPCLRFGSKGERVRSPLPELILERVTSGVFYDVVNGGGAVRDDYGRRFESYCARHLEISLSELTWEREFPYVKKPATFISPDIICSKDNEVSIAFECKSTRMSHEAMFGSNPILARGFEDISKAVYQLWRFFSHCRRGYVDRTLNDDVVGVVLTLDNWLVLAETLRKQVLENAEALSREKDPEISIEDKKPVKSGVNWFVVIAIIVCLLSVAVFYAVFSPEEEFVPYEQNLTDTLNVCSTQEDCDVNLCSSHNYFINYTDNVSFDVLLKGDCDLLRGRIVTVSIVPLEDNKIPVMES
jgi:hypothetical protein